MALKFVHCSIRLFDNQNLVIIWIIEYSVAHLLGRKPKHGGSAFISFSESSYEKSTYIWYQHRQKWRQGPVIPNTFMETDFCTVALNTSAVMLIGGYYDNQNIFERTVFVYNFEIASWIKFPDISQELGEMTWYCSAAIIMDKNAEK